VFLRIVEGTEDGILKQTNCLEGSESLTQETTVDSEEAVLPGRSAGSFAMTTFIGCNARIDETPHR
jgi:hypothetical protein